MQAPARRKGRREGGFGFMGFNAQTPETEHTTHYFWSGAQNYTLDQPDCTRRLRTSLETTFGEDKVIVESQYAMMLATPNAPQISIGTDSGMVQARRMIKELIDKERHDETERSTT